VDGDLVALFVHDLKNPLAALRANVGYVGGQVEDEMVKEAVDDCMLSVEVLTRLIENFSVMSRLEGGEELTATPCTVDIMLESVAKKLEAHAATMSLTIESSAEPSLPAITVPTPLLALALENLVACACTHAPAGSVVRLRGRSVASLIEICVIDDGPPVAESFRSLLGDRDAQTQVKSQPGARYARGLGLYVASLVATHSGGQLDATAEEDGASSLRMIFPAA